MLFYLAALGLLECSMMVSWVGFFGWLEAMNHILVLGIELGFAGFLGLVCGVFAFMGLESLLRAFLPSFVCKK